MREFDQKIFSERLRDLRQGKNLSFGKLQGYVGISDSALNDWENCKRTPTIDKVFKLAQFFDVSIDYLVGLKDY